MLSNEEREKYLDKMSEAVDRLSDLITNILKLNKLENQKLNPNITNFNLSELLAECIVKHAPIFEAKAIEMICYIDQDVYINSEKSYLEIVFNNLISNAIKFTDNAGSITIHLKKINDEYIFSIEDTGCGIDNETGKHIFDKFYQGALIICGNFLVKTKFLTHHLNHSDDYK